MKRAKSDGVLLARSDLSGGVILRGDALACAQALHTTEILAEEMRDVLSAGARQFRWRRGRREIETPTPGDQTRALLKVEDLAVEADRAGAWFMMTFITREPMSFFLTRPTAMILLDSLDQCFSDNLNDKWAAGMVG